MRRFRAYQQTEHSDCGVACIRMICRHYGLRVSPHRLRTLTDVGRLGMTVAVPWKRRRMLASLTSSVRFPWALTHA